MLEIIGRGERIWTSDFLLPKQGVYFFRVCKWLKWLKIKGWKKSNLQGVRFRVRVFRQSLTPHPHTWFEPLLPTWTASDRGWVIALKRPKLKWLQALRQNGGACFEVVKVVKGTLLTNYTHRNIYGKWKERTVLGWIGGQKKREINSVEMPRCPRLDAPGTLHHIIVRGIERRKIVDNDKDRENFVTRMGSIALDTGTSIYAWALMTNHAHILLRSSTAGLPTFMRRFLSGYAFMV